MAAEVGGMPNGTYAPHHGYGMDQNAYAYSANTPAPVSQPPAQQPPQASTTPSNAPAAQQPQSEISKDEVGWYFVEQYYTTLSRSPEKLYLFYNKRSQFVSGTETDKVPVCVGQRAINDRIQELSFQDCKVRVTNVDSQASDSNIVIQVIGELSNKSQPHKKFCQTFVLATQTNGYFVLNDVFRYLADEEEEDLEQESEPAAATAAPTEEIQQAPGTESGFQEPPPTEVEPKTLTSSADPAAVERDAKSVDKEIEEKLTKQQQAEEVAAPKVNGEHAAEPEKEKEAEAPAEPEPTKVEEAPAEPELQPEKPKDPEPTPVASPPKQAPAQPAAAPKPAAPAVPMSWASRAAAANKVATPVTPSTASSAAAAKTPAAAKTATPPAAPAASSAAAQTAAAPSAPAAAAPQEAQTPESQDEWSTVTSSHNRQQSRQTNAPSQQEGPQFRGYIKSVSENVTKDDLEAKLKSLFGDLEYLDIARQKVRVILCK